MIDQHGKVLSLVQKLWERPVRDERSSERILRALELFPHGASLPIRHEYYRLRERMKRLNAQERYPFMEGQPVVAYYGKEAAHSFPFESSTLNVPTVYHESDIAYQLEGPYGQIIGVTEDEWMLLNEETYQPILTTGHVIRAAYVSPGVRTDRVILHHPEYETTEIAEQMADWHIIFVDASDDWLPLVRAIRQNAQSQRIILYNRTERAIPEQDRWLLVQSEEAYNRLHESLCAVVPQETMDSFLTDAMSRWNESVEKEREMYDATLKDFQLQQVLIDETYRFLLEEESEKIEGECSQLAYVEQWSTEFQHYLEEVRDGTEEEQTFSLLEKELEDIYISARQEIELTESSSLEETSPEEDHEAMKESLEEGTKVIEELFEQVEQNNKHLNLMMLLSEDPDAVSEEELEELGELEGFYERMGELIEDPDVPPHQFEEMEQLFSDLEQLSETMEDPNVKSEEERGLSDSMQPSSGSSFMWLFKKPSTDYGENGAQQDAPTNPFEDMEQLLNDLEQYSEIIEDPNAVSEEERVALDQRLEEHKELLIEDDDYRVADVIERIYNMEKARRPSPLEEGIDDDDVMCLWDDRVFNKRKKTDSFPQPYVSQEERWTAWCIPFDDLYPGDHPTVYAAQSMADTLFLADVLANARTLDLNWTKEQLDAFVYETDQRGHGLLTQLAEEAYLSNERIEKDWGEPILSTEQHVQRAMTGPVEEQSYHLNLAIALGSEEAKHLYVKRMNASLERDELTDEAIEAFIEFMTTCDSEDDPKWTLEIGMAYAALEIYQEANKYLSTLPHHPTALYVRADMEQKGVLGTRDLGQALEMVELALDVYQDEKEQEQESNKPKFNKKCNNLIKEIKEKIKKENEKKKANDGNYETVTTTSSSESLAERAIDAIRDFFWF